MIARAPGAVAGLVICVLALYAHAEVSVTRRVLANGMRLLVREDSTTDVVAVSLQVRAGSRDEQPEEAGITNLLHRVMVRGAGRRTGPEVVEAAEDLGGSIDASGDVDAAEVRARGLARHWEPLLGLVADVALAPTLPDLEVERERRLTLALMRTRADTPFLASIDVLLEDLYGPHPYGVPRLGRAASIERATREDLARRHAAIYRADRMALAVSGAVERDRVVRAAEQLFGRTPTGGDRRARDESPPAPRTDRRLIERPMRQAQLLLGYLAPGVMDADFAAVKVLGAVLGGGMAGRLFMRLRAEETLAYSLGVMTPSRGGPGFLVAHVATSPRNVVAAEERLLRELASIRDNGVTEAELARAKAHVLGQLAVDRQTNARQAWSLAHYEVLGVGWDFADRLAGVVSRVTRAEVHAAARRYLTRPTTVVLQPRR